MERVLKGSQFYLHTTRSSATEWSMPLPSQPKVVGLAYYW